jgi:thiamine biosynthesis lipoprotein
VIAFAFLAVLSFPLPSAAGEPLSRTRFLMGTTCEIIADVPPSAYDAAFDEIGRVEGLLSTWRDDSSLALLNRTAGGEAQPVTAELFALLSMVTEWSARTNGAFNPLLGPLVELWGIRGSGASPSNEGVAAAVEMSRHDRLELDRNTLTVRLRRGATIEEGAFGKGYALDRAMQLLIDRGCHACLIDFGGQLALFGEEPRHVAIAHPASRQRAALTVTLSRGSLATTSGSEKWFEAFGERLSHVIDPRTGRALPPRGSVTVIHDSALAADILSTALYVMGPEEGLRWADAHEVAVVFIVPDASGWRVLTSLAANNPGLSLTRVSADF